MAEQTVHEAMADQAVRGAMAIQEAQGPWWSRQFRRALEGAREERALAQALEGWMGPVERGLGQRTPVEVPGP
ncbi:hypothetical protein QQF64_018846 [Cirrhinus molitorella]|uniref:Uncharacterized protein n=1 Tax=Cirrhinus molitorella TaxID=172907 RepID=A0ABR3LFD1_9TELE